jgi:hypothetical protein
MTESLLTSSSAAVPATDTPPIPQKFLDPETGAPDVAKLARSYLELERKLSTMIAVPGDDADEAATTAFRRALGIPETPDAYDINVGSDLLDIDPDVNGRMHAAHFTPRQAQLVYDLAAERMLPAIADMASEFEAQKQRERLVAHFGGDGAWREIARQMNAWGTAHLPRDVFEALASTSDGVLALHTMMQSGAPPRLAGSGTAVASLTEEDLAKMMRDPRYWKHKDPAFMAEVSEGFRRLYPGESS